MGVRGPDRTPQERRVIYRAMMNGASCEELNGILARLGYRPMCETMHRLLADHEAKLFRWRPELIDHFVLHPVPYTLWKAEWKEVIQR